MNEIQTADLRPVNMHATVHVGREHAGDLFDVYDARGNMVKSEAKVAPQGTIYVGANHAGGEVAVERADSISGDE